MQKGFCTVFLSKGFVTQGSFHLMWGTVDVIGSEAMGMNVWYHLSIMSRILCDSGVGYETSARWKLADSIRSARKKCQKRISCPGDTEAPCLFLVENKQISNVRVCERVRTSREQRKMCELRGALHLPINRHILINSPAFSYFP